NSYPWIIPGLALVWLIGSALVALLNCVRIIRLMEMLRHRRPADAALLESVRAAAEQINVAPIACRVVSGIGSPVICSLLRPVLLWPAELHALSRDACRALVIHELAH